MTKAELEAHFHAAQGGNEEAFGKIYEYYYNKLSAYVYRRVLGKEITEDIISNTFFKVVKNLKKFKWKSAPQFNGWMYRIATNEVHAYFRKKDRYQFSAPEDLEGYFNDNSEKASLEEELTQKLDIERDFSEISSVIGELKPYEQSIIHLRFFEDMNLKEIAAVVKKSEGSVRVALHRTLKKLEGRVQSEKLSYLG